MASLTDRMIRAAKLDVSLYEEVEADKGAMGQAMGVVIQRSKRTKEPWGRPWEWSFFPVLLQESELLTR